MKKMLFGLVAVLLIAGCKPEDEIALPRDTSVPTFTYPMVSTASVTKFTAFGGTLPNLTTSKGYNFHITDTAQRIVSASAGIVSDISTLNEGTITVIYKQRSVYSFIYSGVRETPLHVNDTIAPSTVLGKLATSGNFSFTVVKNDEVLCPEQFGSSGFNSAVASAIYLHNQNNPGDSVPSACLVSSLPK